MRTLVSIIIVMGLIGCQTIPTNDLESGTNTLSLEEAKKATIAYQSATFTPAKRTISDIRRSLGKARNVPTNCDGTRHRRLEMLDVTLSQPAKGGDTLYHVTRGSMGMLVHLNRQIERGQYSDTIAMVRKAFDNVGFVTSAHVLWLASLEVQLARIHASIGESERAREHLSSAERRLRWSGSSGSYETRAVDAATKVYSPFIHALQARLDNRSELAEEQFRLAYKNRFFMPAERSPISFSRMHSEIATELLLQGRIAEAEYEARAAWWEQYYANDNLGGGDKSFNSLLALPTTQLAELYLLRGRIDDARYLAEMAVNLHEVDCAFPDSVSLARAQHVSAQVRASEGDWKGILSQFKAIRNSLGRDEEKFERLYGGNLMWNLALAQTGAATEASRRLSAILERRALQEGANSDAVAEIRGFLARAQFKSGEQQSALVNFGKAVDVLLGHWSNTRVGASQSVQNLRRQLILDGYIDALLKASDAPSATVSGIDPVAKLFQIANVAHLGRVQQALTASTARSAAADPELSQLVRADQDASHGVEAILTVLSTLELAPPDQINSQQVVRLQEQFVKLTAARRTIGKEILAKFPEYANLINPGPASLSEAAAALSDDEALITFLGKDTYTLVWAVNHTGAVSFARVPVSGSDLARRVAQLRQSVVPKGETLGDLTTFDVSTSYALFRDLLEPVQSGWDKSNNLLIVPHGALGQLPFALLVTEDAELPTPTADDVLFSDYRDIPWLIKRVTLARYPSVNALITLRQSTKRQRGPRVLIAFADPYFSPEQIPDESPHTLAQANVGALRRVSLRRRKTVDTRGLASATLSNLPRLPETADEVRGIMRALKAEATSSVFTGTQANEQVVKTSKLSSYQFVVFATHGLQADDLDGLTQPALALTTPEISKVEGDGLLTMDEILGLTLNADWVVLSACDTGAGDGAGAEAVSGLGRAFFYAGARSLLVSNWPVETTSAAMLTTQIFQSIADNPRRSRAEGLRDAILYVLGASHRDPESGRELFSYAHPIFWAPFTLIGDARR